MIRWENSDRIKINGKDAAGILEIAGTKKDFSTNNISANGMMIVSQSALEVGKTIDFKIRFAQEGLQIEGCASVVWGLKEFTENSVDYVLGCEFINLNMASRSVLQKVLYKHANQEGAQTNNYAQVA